MPLEQQRRHFASRTNLLSKTLVPDSDVVSALQGPPSSERFHGDSTLCWQHGSLSAFTGQVSFSSCHLICRDGLSRIELLHSLVSFAAAGAVMVLFTSGSRMMKCNWPCCLSPFWQGSSMKMRGPHVLAAL